MLYKFRFYKKTNIYTIVIVRTSSKHYVNLKRFKVEKSTVTKNILKYV